METTVTDMADTATVVMGMAAMDTEATAATDADMADAVTVEFTTMWDTVATDADMAVADMAVMELDTESVMDMEAAMADMESFINLNNTLIKLYSLAMQTDRIFIKYCKIVYQL